MYAHIIPRFYLAFWANENGNNLLYLFKKETNRYTERPVSATRIFGENNYYYFYLFPKDGSAPENEETRQFLLRYYFKTFKSFFDQLDLNLFSDKELMLNGKKIEENPTYHFVYSYYSDELVAIPLKGETRNPIPKMALKTLIEQRWNDSKNKETEENLLSKEETKGRDVLVKVINAINAEDTETILKFHEELASFISVQQTRNPLDSTIKASIQDSVEAVKSLLANQDLSKLFPRDFDEEDTKAICMVQMLIYYYELPNGKGKYQSALQALRSTFNDCVFLYLKAKRHLFVTNDSPIIVCKLQGKKHFFFMPLSPSCGVLIAKQDPTRKMNDKILLCGNEITNYFNWLTYRASRMGIISRDRRFVNKERPFPKEALIKTLNKMNVSISDWFK